MRLGYGQLGRSFGLFGDHVLSLEIIDTDGNSREITKANDPDLFWAFLGGSPGNLGVLTHFTIQVHQDEDYNGSRGMKALYFYDTKTLKRLVDMLVEMSDNEDFPRNYDLCISVLSSAFPLLDLWPGLDEVMARKHPELYGDNGVIAWPRAIIVYAQWVPFESGDKCDMSWFDRIKEGSDWVLGKNDVEVKPMSQLTGDWIFRNVREFEKPYVVSSLESFLSPFSNFWPQLLLHPPETLVKFCSLWYLLTPVVKQKRTYTTNSHTLAKDGWAEWVVNRIDAIVKPEHNRCWLSAQLQCFGGKNSMFTRNAGNGTAYSWRDTSICCTMDCFQ